MKKFTVTSMSVSPDKKIPQIAGSFREQFMIHRGKASPIEI